MKLPRQGKSIDRSGVRAAPRLGSGIPTGVCVGMWRRECVPIDTDRPRPTERTKCNQRVAAFDWRILVVRGFVNERARRSSAPSSSASASHARIGRLPEGSLPDKLDQVKRRAPLVDPPLFGATPLRCPTSAADAVNW